MRRVIFATLVGGALLTGLTLPRPWTEVEQARADSQGVVKCVGFDANTAAEAMVYVHNDSSDTIDVIVRFIDAFGKTAVPSVSGSVPSFQTFIVGRSPDANHFINIAKISASDKRIIVGAEWFQTDSPLNRYHVNCAASYELPDGLQIKPLPSLLPG